MPNRIVLLSGPIAAGKSTLAAALKRDFGFYHVKTGELIKAQLQVDSRTDLQLAGERLDAETNGEWIAKAIDRIVTQVGLGEDSAVVVDSVRIEGQIEATRKAFGSRVVHIHITAPPEALQSRWESRRKDRPGEPDTYEAVKANQTEANVDGLRDIADVVIDSLRNTAEDIVVRVAAHLGLYGRSVDRLVDVIVGGQYGSEGKGNVVSYLGREYSLLVRVGGPNAGHKVYEEPEPYTFHHLPSGTRHSEANLLLGPGAVIYIPALLKEIAECEVTAQRLFIDPQAMIIEDLDRADEESLVKSIGSTGQGVGAATARKVLRGSTVRLARDAQELKPYLQSARSVIEKAYSRGERILLEGTQGTALSLHHGFYPHVTSRDTTVSGCLAEAGIAPSRVRRVVMVCRTYPIRVQSPLGSTSGDMGVEIDLPTISQRSGIQISELEKTETTSTTKKKRRIAEFDWSLLRRSSLLNGPTDIALTFVDYLNVKNRNARRFEQLTPETIRFMEEVERVSGAPVSLISTRFHSRCIIDRRKW